MNTTITAPVTFTNSKDIVFTNKILPLYNDSYNNAAYNAAQESFAAILPEDEALKACLNLQDAALCILGSPYHNHTRTYTFPMTPEAILFLYLFR